MPSYTISVQFCVCSYGSNGSLAPSFEAECPDRQKGQNRTAAGHIMTSLIAKLPPLLLEGFVYYNCIFICE